MSAAVFELLGGPMDGEQIQLDTSTASLVIRNSASVRRCWSLYVRKDARTLKHHNDCRSLDDALTEGELLRDCDE